MRRKNTRGSLKQGLSCLPGNFLTPCDFNEHMRDMDRRNEFDESLVGMINDWGAGLGFVREHTRIAWRHCKNRRVRMPVIVHPLQEEAAQAPELAAGF